MNDLFYRCAFYLDKLSTYDLRTMGYYRYAIIAKLPPSETILGYI